MIGYGMAKAAVHQLTKSLAEPDSGLPEGASAVAILPYDTPGSRVQTAKITCGLQVVWCFGLCFSHAFS